VFVLTPDQVHACAMCEIILISWQSSLTVMQQCWSEFLGLRKRSPEGQLAHKHNLGGKCQTSSSVRSGRGSTTGGEEVSLGGGSTTRW